MAHDKRIGGSLTAANIAKHLSDLIATTLAGVRIVGLVADNASNMQAAMRQVVVGGETAGAPTPTLVGAFSMGEIPAVFQRCAAHGDQLCVHDLLLLEPFEDVKSDAERAKADTGICECIVETRWNTMYDVIVAALAVHKVWEEASQQEKERLPHIEDTDVVARLRRVSPVLKVFADSTNKVQANNATLWTAAEALQLLIDASQRTGTDAAHIRAVIEKRAPTLITPGLLLIAYLAPNLTRPALPNQAIMNLQQLHIDGVTRRHMDEALEFRNARWQFFDDKNAGITREQYLDHCRGDSPTAQLLLRLLAVAPTEAAVERVFSHMKFNVGHYRTTMAPEAASSQVMRNASQRFLQPPSDTKSSDSPAPAAPGPIYARTWNWIVMHGWPHLQANGEPNGVANDRPVI
jgi:hypothetical protein